jgi:phospholipase C
MGTHRAHNLDELLVAKGPDPILKDPEDDMQLNDLKHLVVVMFENRSFDHMLGSLDLDPHGPWATLEGVRHAGKASLHPLTGHGGPGHVYDQSFYSYSGNPILTNDRRSRFFPDPPHERPDVASQLNNGKMDGFVSAYQAAYPGVQILLEGSPEGPPYIVPLPWPEDILGYYTPTDLPLLHALASEGAVCDHWFCSVPTSTFPNRFYSLCGTSGGFANTWSGTSFVQKQYREIPITSVFEVLAQAGLDHPWDWAIYSAPLKGLLAEIFTDMLYGIVPPVPGFTATFFGGAAEKQRIRRHWHDLNDFETGFKSNVLPTLTWIEPRDVDLADDSTAPNDDHPPTPIENGQRLLWRILQSLKATEAWANTMLIVTYDEHGGFYDHVTPPLITAPCANDVALGFTHYGVRVPTVIVSPLIPAQTVISAELEHTSILRLIGQWLNIPTVLQMPRVGGAPDLAAVLGNLPSPAAPTTIAPPVAAARRYRFER